MLGHTADEGSEEHMKKKMKNLEDQIKKLTGTNSALTETVRALQKEKADTRHDDSNEDDSDENDSPMLFSSRKVYTFCSPPHRTCF